MFGFLKSLLRKGSQGKVPTPAPSPPGSVTPSRAVPSAAPTVPSSPARPASAVPALVASEDAVAVSLAAIFQRLPSDLKTRVARVPKVDVTVAIPRAHLMAQLPRGEVRIRWGDLRQLAPSGTISGSSDRDAESVEIPLAEVLSRLGSGSVGLRRDQRRVEIPEEVGAVFGPKGRGEAPAKPAAAKKTEPAAAKEERLASPPAEVVAAAAPVVELPKPAPALPVPEPVVVRPPLEAEPIKPLAPLPDLGVGRGAEALAGAGAPAVVPAGGRRPSVPVLMPGTMVAQVELEVLMAGWPEKVREALAGWREEVVFVPLGDLEAGLRSGRVRVTWGRLQGWMAQGPGGVLGEGEELELPLSVLAPLFMQVRKPAGVRREVRVEEEIPALFSPKAAAAPAVEAPVKTVAAGVGGEGEGGSRGGAAAGPAVAGEGAAGLTIGEALGDPGRTEWSPVDLVRATAVLEGVAGAVVTMHDGFLVAGQLPPEQEAEAFAALVPELHGRINQFATDLRLAPHAVVTVTIGEVPLWIQRTPSVFFGVLGRAGKALPVAKLAVIVRHLD